MGKATPIENPYPFLGMMGTRTRMVMKTGDEDGKGRKQFLFYLVPLSSLCLVFVLNYLGVKLQLLFFGVKFGINPIYIYIF